MIPWAIQIPEVVAYLETDLKKGLTAPEVERRLSNFGPNVLPTKSPTPISKLIANQLEDLLVVILLVAAAISFVLAAFEDDEDFSTAVVEPCVILLILIANAAVGVFQEKNAEKAIQALKSLEASSAIVLRDSKFLELDSKVLVPGDIIKLSSGDKVPADCRLSKLISTQVLVDQSILTGESKSCYKVEMICPRCALNQDKKNMLFSGTLITKGMCIAVVTATARETEFGKIQSELEEVEEEKTPLKKDLDRFGETLSKVIGMVCVLVWLVNIHHFDDPVHGGIVKGAVYYFKIAVALAVAAVPEGLPAVVTTCLALGTRAMAKEGAIVRTLSSVETLGATTVICADKTGTLTRNEMLAKFVLYFSCDGVKVSTLETDGKGYSPNIVNKISESPLLHEIARASSLCNDSSVWFDGVAGEFVKTGEPTEAALKTLSAKLVLGMQDQPELHGKAEDINRTLSQVFMKVDNPYIRYATLEFERKRKTMSIIATNQLHASNAVFVKGACESVLPKCTKYCQLDGTEVRFTAEHLTELQAQIVNAGAQSYRLIALAMRSVLELPNSDVLCSSSFRDQLEQNLTLLGVVAIHDPVRSDAAAAVKKCQDAGIRVVMVSGDGESTCIAVAKTLGIIDTCATENALRDGQVITGYDWQEMNDSEKAAVVKKVKVVARVDPVHKLSIVQMLKLSGEVVAMTGDGVNDAPALKCANIGISMGSGTQVAREASDMVLSTNNFATVPLAVEHGRSIFANTKQFIRYLVSSNIGEVACIFFSAALGIPEGLIPIQLLWVNLVTDGFPATALGFNRPDHNAMNECPRSQHEGIVTRWLLIRYIIVGIYVGVAVVVGFLWWFMYYADGPQLDWATVSDFENCSKREHAICTFFRWGSEGQMSKPSTVSLSILVTIEMLNALNSLSENESLLDVPPWSNPFLVCAIIMSFALHLCILYTPWLASIFSVAPLSVTEWCAVLTISLPVILIDELLKYFSRNSAAKWKLRISLLDSSRFNQSYKQV